MLQGLLVDLVPYSQKFLDQDHKWRNGPGVFFWAMGDQWVVTKANIEAAHRRHAEQRERGGRRIMFGMQTKDGIPIGLFGINHLNEYHRIGMLTAMIGEPDYWGGGYGTDGLLLIVDYAFDWLDLRKVWLATAGFNIRVQRQMEKVGFTLEARQSAQGYGDGEWTDGLVYGLLRDEWPGRAAMIEKLGLHQRIMA